MTSRKLAFFAAGAASGALVALAGPVGALADDEGGHGHGANFRSTGSGVYTSGGTPGCQNGGTCTVTSQGAATVKAGSQSFAATWTATSSVDYRVQDVLLFNGGSYYCAPTTSSVTIKSTPNPADTITKVETGYTCASTAKGASHTFFGRYVITGGTGTFAHASGSGNAFVQDDGGFVITTADEWGSIHYASGGGGGDKD